MFSAWNIIDAGLHRGSTGHHYWETKALADELLTRGVDVRVLSHKNTPVERIPGARIYPTFSLGYYSSVSNDPFWSKIENFIVHNRRFQYDLSRAERTVFHGSLAFFPTLSERQLLGTIRWLAHFEDIVRPKAVVGLHILTDWSESNFPLNIYRMIWASCPAAVKKDLTITVRTKDMANKFYQLVDVMPQVLPWPLGVPERRAQIAATVGTQPPGPMVVSFVGGARRERGTTLIPEVVKLCAPLDMRFFIQVKSEGTPEGDLHSLAALRGFPNVELHEGVLEPYAYYDAIARSVVLIPYAPNFYRWRSSGVYVDAKFLGAPVIVAAGSSMAEEVKSFGNGLVFEEYSPSAIAACLLKAYHEIGNLRKRAAVCARKFSAENGPDRCVDAIESLVTNKYT